METLFSLVYTSVRPGRIAQVLKDWDSRATLNQHEWVISIDAGNDACLAAAANVQTDRPCQVAVNTGPANCVSGWNTAAERSTGKVIIAVADDFMPPAGWDSQLATLTPPGWMDREHVVHVSDGYNPDIFTLAIVTRKRYERMGYLFYPSYQSLFCDTELTATAIRDNVVLDATKLIFEHQHPDCQKRPRDDADLKHASTDRWKSGEALFNLRKSLGFPIDAGPRAQAQNVSARNDTRSDAFIAYMQVIKDDLCLYEVCMRLHEEGVTDFFWATPDEYWSGEPITDSDHAELDACAKRLRDNGLTVHCCTLHVAETRIQGETRIQLETRVRNASVKMIRELGYQHILVVDGDELWMRGTLDLLKPYIAQGASALRVGLIPVIGLPAYPVDGALRDGAVVYIGPGQTFKECRTPARSVNIPMARIYHFTGLRRDMDEIVKKHKRSGHYGDPDYDFDGWLANTLPRIKPGAQNVHMYKHYQLWPAVRSWRSSDLADIPDTLHKYLGKD